MSNQMSVKERLEGLKLCQMIELRRQADEIIKKAEAEPRRIVWRVSDGIYVINNFRTEDFAKASDLLLTIYKEKFDENAADFIKNGGRIRDFNDECPSVFPEFVTQLEYENEWFPGEVKA